MASQFPVDDNDQRCLLWSKRSTTFGRSSQPTSSYRDRTEDHERRMELSRTLMVLAANVVTDLAELRRLGFRSLLLPPSN